MSLTDHEAAMKAAVQAVVERLGAVGKNVPLPILKPYPTSTSDLCVVDGMVDASEVARAAVEAYEAKCRTTVRLPIRPTDSMRRSGAYQLRVSMAKGEDLAGFVYDAMVARSDG